MKDEQLFLMREKQVEILSTINEICNKHEIKYSLFAGTALGAIRHKGFIPWDDDLDIVMSRNDFIKFKSICKLELPDHYFFQDFHSDKNFNQCFAKIRDTNTAYIEKSTVGKLLHKGIFVDIFPFDVVPRSKYKTLIQYFFASLNILLARSRPYSEGRLVLNLISRIILFLIPVSLRHKVKCFSEKQISKYRSDREGYYSELTSIVGLLKKKYPIDILDETVEVVFENNKFPVFKNYDKYLEIKFGDYMQLPPKSERRLKHNPIICDTEKSYLEYER